MKQLCDLPVGILEKIVTHPILSPQDISNFAASSQSHHAYTAQHVHLLVDIVGNGCKDKTNVLERLMLHTHDDPCVAEIVRIGRLLHAITYACKKQNIFSKYNYHAFLELITKFMYVPDLSISLRSCVIKYLVARARGCILLMGDGSCLEQGHFNLVFGKICREDKMRIDVVELLLMNGLHIRKFMIYDTVVNHAPYILACIIDFVRKNNMMNAQICNDIRCVYDMVESNKKTLRSVEFHYLDPNSQKRLIHYYSCMRILKSIIPVL